MAVEIEEMFGTGHRARGAEKRQRRHRATEPRCHRDTESPRVVNVSLCLSASVANFLCASASRWRRFTRTAPPGLRCARTTPSGLP
jgi:hypothetical protein